MNRLANKNVWITGGGSGIGRALALAYASEGRRIWISGRNLEKLQEVANAATHMSGEVIPVALDVTDAAQSQQVFKEIEASSGGLDIVILSAGNHVEMPVSAFKHEVCESLMRVNYFGVTHLLDSLLPVFLKRDKGQIAIVASLAGYRGLPLAAAYGASKAALIALAESLKVETINTGVDIRLINPGFVRSPLTDKNQFDMPFLMEPEDAAKEIVSGLKSRHFEIRFPRPFAWMLQLLSMLPYTLYMKLIRRITQQ